MKYPCDTWQLRGCQGLALLFGGLQFFKLHIIDFLKFNITLITCDYVLSNAMTHAAIKLTQKGNLPNSKLLLL